MAATRTTARREPTARGPRTSSRRLVPRKWPASVDVPIPGLSPDAGPRRTPRRTRRTA